MPNTLTAAKIFETLSGLGENVASVILPRPAIEVSGDKLRIAAKNAAQAVKAGKGEHTALQERLLALELSDLQSPGAAFYSDGKDVYELRFSEAPVGMAVTGAPALWLPAVADASSRSVAWAAVVDRQAPKIYRVSAHGLEDFSDIIELPDYDDIHNRREPQLDNMFHSTSSARRTAGHGGFAKFHALGTSQQQEEDKTDDVFYREFVQAIEHGLPRTARKLYLIGEENNVGHAMTHAEGDTFIHPEFVIETIQDGALGQAPDRLLNTLTDNMEADRRMAGFDKLEALAPESRIDPDALSTAGTNGRVEAVWVSAEEAGLREFPDDEVLSFDDVQPAKRILDLQEKVAAALITGASIEVVPGVLLPGNASAIGVARYTNE